VFLLHPVYSNKPLIGHGLGVFAHTLSLLGVERLFLKGLSKHFGNQYIRVINYHDIPPPSAQNFEKQPLFFREHFTSVSFKEFEEFLVGKKWISEKPGLIISFDDGLRTNYDVALPLLEKYGFIGLFFVPVDFIDHPTSTQKQFALEHDIIKGEYVVYYRDCRIAMSSEELRNLVAHNHVVGCHTRTHHRMRTHDSHEVIEREISHASELGEISALRNNGYFICEKEESGG
jgi:peptidoglycan/xylan/chitin deacetylase (PgdA/CDA1 family)